MEGIQTILRSPGAKAIVTIDRTSVNHGLSITVASTKVVRVDWIGNLVSYKKDYSAFCFMLCARSRLGSFVLGVMLY